MKWQQFKYLKDSIQEKLRKFETLNPEEKSKSEFLLKSSMMDIIFALNYFFEIKFFLISLLLIIERNSFVSGKT